MSEDVLSAALARMRGRVFRRAADRRHLAIPDPLDSFLLQHTDAEVWAAILTHNAGLIGVVRRIPLTVNGLLDRLWSR